MSTPEHFDVLIVGAGISGIGAAYHLGQKCPDHTYAILEGRADLGGTWDLFRYPGVRSDSDMHTLGYSFKPWTGAKAIADGPSILTYLRETAAQYGIDQQMRFNSLVTAAAWDSAASTWTLTVTNAEANDQLTYTCNYLFMCSGYYSYKGGYTPDFPGADEFGGQIVHPQKWPEDIDYVDKRVVVIGSGATAVTLVPAMADETEHITMLQRSPTYMVARPDQDAMANRLRKILPEKVAYAITRWKNVRLSDLMYRKARSEPDKVREQLLDLVREEMGPDYDVDKHFTPSYNPWDQRLCLVPNSDIFSALKDGSASIVTDTIERFTKTGIELTSGEHLDADIIVTATGLQLVTVGEMDFTVDGATVDFSQSYTYKGLAYSDVPNMASSFGYINASWTLRADITCDWVCRVLNHMSETNTTQVTPRLRPSDANMAQRSWIEDFSSGYMARIMPMMPKQGDREPWVNIQRYVAERKSIGKAPVNDDVLEFTTARQPAEATT